MPRKNRGEPVVKTKRLPDGTILRVTVYNSKTPGKGKPHATKR